MCKLSNLQVEQLQLKLIQLETAFSTLSAAFSSGRSALVDAETGIALEVNRHNGHSLNRRRCTCGRSLDGCSNNVGVGKAIDSQKVSSGGHEDNGITIWADAVTLNSIEMGEGPSN